MSLLSRRTFLASAGLLAAGYVTMKAFSLPAALAAPALQSDFAVDGKIHFIGLNSPPGLMPANYVMPNSLLTTLDLKTGRAQQSELEIREGHAAVPLGDGRIACISHHGAYGCVVDAVHAQIKRLDAPKGYRFGGHGVVLPEQGVLVAPVRRDMSRSAADKGRFLVYDLKTLAEIEQIEAAGLHPHEMRRVLGTDEIAVTHYGDITEPRDPYYAHNILAPKLSIYDAKTLKEKRSYSQREFNALLSHLDIAPDGHAYCVLTQYFYVSDDPAVSAKERRERAVKIITQALGHAPDFDILPQGIAEGRVAMPLPVLRINIHTGEREVLMLARNSQIRSQSVACNQLTGAAVATYFNSDTLMVHRAGKEPVLLSGKKLGIDQVRGATDVPGTPFVALTGSERNAIVLDTRTLEIAARYTTANAYSPHVVYERA